MRTFVPSVQPRLCMASRKAVLSVFHSGSPSPVVTRTPSRRSWRRDEKAADTFPRHRRECSIEIVDSSHRCHEELDTELLARGLECLQGGAVRGRRLTE